MSLFPRVAFARMTPLSKFRVPFSRWQRRAVVVATGVAAVVTYDGWRHHDCARNTGDLTPKAFVVFAKGPEVPNSSQEAEKKGSPFEADARDPIAALLGLHRSGGWTVTKTDKAGVVLEERPVPGSSFKAARVSATFPASARDALIALWADTSKDLSWNPLQIDRTVLASNGPDDTTELQRYRSPSIGVWPRDFVSHRKSGHAPDGEYVYGYVCAGERADAPPDAKNFVRAACRETGFIITAPHAGCVTVFYLCSIEPRGWVPAAAVNAVNADHMAKLHALRKILGADVLAAPAPLSSKPSK